MGKKRKTRQEKIILQLKRQLAQQTASTPEKSTGSKARQEAISKPKPQAHSQKPAVKKPGKSVFFYDPSLVKKDLLKSLALTLIVISFEIVLYLRLR